MITAIARPASARSITLGAATLQTVGHVVLRYGTVFLLTTGGLAKFTSAEAEFIQPLMAHSPLFAWLYGVTSVQGASVAIGLVEIVLGVLLAVHLWWPRLAAIGAVGAALQFICTLSFLFTTPNLSAEMGGFLSKDLILFGAAVWGAGESRGAAQARHAALCGAPQPHPWAPM